MKNPIEMLATRLQSLPTSVRWLYAQQEVIQATALGHVPLRGPWSQRADRMVALSSRFGLARILAAIVNLSLLIVLYVRQSLVRRLPVAGALLIGIKASREPELVRLFAAMQARPIVHVDERDLSDFLRQAHVPFFALLHEMRSVWREVWEHLHSSQPTMGFNRSYLLSFLLMRGHRFAHLRAWFRQYRSQFDTVTAVAWTSASYLSYAPVAVGIETVHMEHGFLRHSLIYPDFARSICFNGFDAAHLRQRLPRCAVSVVAEPAQFLATRRVAAVAGIAWEPGHFDLIRPFIDWALRNNLSVIVRKHPVDTSNYWEQWRRVSGVEITTGEGSFIQFLEKFQPRLLASWFSTALFEAIVRGVVPVTVTPKNHEAAIDTVFPFRDLCLCWPEHAERARNFLDDDDLRGKFLVDSYARCMGTHVVDESKMAVKAWPVL